MSKDQIVKRGPGEALWDKEVSQQFSGLPQAGVDKRAGGRAAEQKGAASGLWGWEGGRGESGPSGRLGLGFDRGLTPVPGVQLHHPEITGG